MIDDPVALFTSWYQQAENDPSTDAAIVSLATATPEGLPSVRIVLFRGMREGGLSFFTNYESRKGRELRANPFAAMVFYWPRLGRQVRVEGSVERLSSAASDDYFRSRSFESQVSAFVSRQSSPVNSANAFHAKLEDLERSFRGKPVPRPDYWGGFKIVPAVFEFWTQGEHRRHTRVRYEKVGDVWSVSELYP